MDLKAIAQKIILIVILIICIGLSIVQFFGLLELKWFVEKSSSFILFVICLIALYSMLDENRISKRLSSVFFKSHKDILEKISIKQNHASIIDAIEFRWSERESEIYRFLEEIKQDGSKVNENTLYNKLDQYQNSFILGEVFNTKYDYPWDITITAMDMNGRYTYHPKESVINRRPNKDHHIEILEQKNGVIFWLNKYSTPEFQKTLNVDEKFHKHIRLTKIYFNEIPTKNIIVMFESHISILYKLPKI